MSNLDAVQILFSIFLLDLAFSQIPKKVNWEELITRGSEQWEWQMIVSKLFDERPIWPKESVTERLLDKGLKFSHLMLKRSCLKTCPPIYWRIHSWDSWIFFIWILSFSVLLGFYLGSLTTFQMDHFWGSGSKRDMILAKILILACKSSSGNDLLL